MNKEEILSKAQKENKGRDIADLEAARRGTNIAFMVGGFAFIAILIVEMVVNNVFHYEILGAITLMCAVAFWVKNISLKKKHEMVAAILYSALSIAWFTLWILRLVKVL